MWRWDPEFPPNFPPHYPRPLPWPGPFEAVTRGAVSEIPYREEKARYFEDYPPPRCREPNYRAYDGVQTRGGGGGAEERDDAFLKSAAGSISFLLTQFEGDDPDPTKPVSQKVLRDLFCCCCQVDGYLKGRGYVSGPVIETRGAATTRGGCGDVVRAIERGDYAGAADHAVRCVREVSRAMDGKK